MAVSKEALAADVRRLVFETVPAKFSEEMAAARQAWSQEYAAGSDEDQEAIAEALVEVSGDIVSYLPRWNLQNGAKHSDTLSCDDLVSEAARNCALLEEWGRGEQAAEVNRVRGEVLTSNLVALSELSDTGKLNVRWGNDYASGLKAAMRKGAVLVTTNPQLVNVAREEAPEVWEPVKAKLKAEHPDYSALELASAMTMQVVAENARLMRPIWNIADGHLGYVSLQLNPKNSKDADAMVEQAEWIFGQIGDLLGGTPNIVFKVPGTKAGLDAAARLTSQAMGVNITVNYSLPQQIAFAEVIEKNSTAKVSFRTQMDGRVDDPIGEELEKLGVPDAMELKKWATRAMRAREFELLLLPESQGGRGYKKSFPLGASGRGPHNILWSLWNGPVTEFITVFPNRREEFDAIPRELRADALSDPVPDGIIDKLSKSELFRKMYEPDGMTPDEFDDYLPCVRTLKQFSDSFDDFVAWLSK